MKNAKAIETRILNPEDLRQLCIEKNWYSCGSNEAYADLLAFASRGPVDTSSIVSIAENIKLNSDTFHQVSDICFEVARICYSSFEIL